MEIPQAETFASSDPAPAYSVTNFTEEFIQNSNTPPTGGPFAAMDRMDPTQHLNSLSADLKEAGGFLAGDEITQSDSSQDDDVTLGGDPESVERAKHNSMLHKLIEQGIGPPLYMAPDEQGPSPDQISGNPAGILLSAPQVIVSNFPPSNYQVVAEYDQIRSAGGSGKRPSQEGEMPSNKKIKLNETSAGGPSGSQSQTTTDSNISPRNAANHVYNYRTREKPNYSQHHRGSLTIVPAPAEDPKRIRCTWSVEENKRLLAILGDSNAPVPEVAAIRDELLRTDPNNSKTLEHVRNKRANLIQKANSKGVTIADILREDIQKMEQGIFEEDVKHHQHGHHKGHQTSHSNNTPHRERHAAHGVHHQSAAPIVPSIKIPTTALHPVNILPPHNMGSTTITTTKSVTEPVVSMGNTTTVTALGKSTKLAAGGKAKKAPRAKRAPNSPKINSESNQADFRQFVISEFRELRRQIGNLKAEITLLKGEQHLSRPEFPYATPEESSLDQDEASGDTPGQDSRSTDSSSSKKTKTRLPTAKAKRESRPQHH